MTRSASVTEFQVRPRIERTISTTDLPYDGDPADLIARACALVPGVRPTRAVWSGHQHDGTPSLTLDFGYLDPDHPALYTSVHIELRYEDARRCCFYLMRHNDPEGLLFFAFDNDDDEDHDGEDVTVPVEMTRGGAR